MSAILQKNKRPVPVAHHGLRCKMQNITKRKAEMKEIRHEDLGILGATYHGSVPAVLLSCTQNALSR